MNLLPVPGQLHQHFSFKRPAVIPDHKLRSSPCLIPFQRIAEQILNHIGRFQDVERHIPVDPPIQEIIHSRPFRRDICSYVGIHHKHQLVFSLMNKGCNIKKRDGIGSLMASRFLFIYIQIIVRGDALKFDQHPLLSQRRQLKKAHICGQAFTHGLIKTVIRDLPHRMRHMDIRKAPVILLRNVLWFKFIFKLPVQIQRLSISHIRFPFRIPKIRVSIFRDIIYYMIFFDKL